MAFAIPTFRQLLDRVRADFGGFTDGTVPPESVEYVLANIQARLTKGLYGFLSYILRQAFPDSAEDTYFWRWFAIFGLEQKQAVPWRGRVTFTGTNGTVIPDGSELQRTDGSLYETDGAVVVSGGEATAVVFATVPGVQANLEAADLVTLSSPIAGVNPEALVESVTQTGSEDESVPEALIRLLAHLRNPPRGGGPGDYVSWALEVAGFTRAWEFAQLEGPNTVSVAAVRDNDGDGFAIIPDAGERAALLAYLQSKAPITARPIVIELVGVSVPIVLSSLTPNTPEVLDAINESLADLFEREAQPNGTILLSKIEEAISAAEGEEDHVLSSPSTNLTFAPNEMPVFTGATI